jgi:hypothetical protein
VPSQRGSSGEPGTAKTSRPKSAALRAVIKEPGAGLPAEGHFADGKALSRGEFVEKADIFRRVGLVEAAGHGGDRAGIEAGAVGGRVDAARKAGDDGIARAADLARQLAGEFHAGDRCVARPDYADARRRRGRAIAFDGQQRRRTDDLAQERGVIRFADADEGGAVPVGDLQFAFRLALAGDADGAGRTTAAREFRQHVQRRLGAAAMIDKLAEGDRPDIVAADEAQPGDPLSFRQRNSPDPCAALVHGCYPLLPILLSVPFRRRLILARCFHQVMRVSSRKSSATFS